MVSKSVKWIVSWEVFEVFWEYLWFGHIPPPPTHTHMQFKVSVSRVYGLKNLTLNQINGFFIWRSLHLFAIVKVSQTWEGKHDFRWDKDYRSCYDGDICGHILHVYPSIWQRQCHCVSSVYKIAECMIVYSRTKIAEIQNAMPEL